MKCSPPGDLTWDLKNPDMIIYWKTLVMCQRYGLDARSIGNVIAWLMKLHELGIITAADTDGVPMNWGSPEAILAVTRKTAYREGFGNLLAEGLPVAAEKIGKGAGDYLVVAHGSPADMHVVPIKTRVLKSAVCVVGGDASVQPPLDWAATRAYVQAKDEASFQEAIKGLKDRAEREIGIREAPDPRTTVGKAALIHQKEIISSACNISGVCVWLTAFLGLTVDTPDIANLLTLGLGKPVTVDSLTEAVLRLHAVERAFSQRLGLGREHDVVSRGFYTHIHRSEKERRDIGCSESELEKMKEDYYELKGWDVKTGLLTRATLERLDLSDVADRLGI
jgi:aldehyde:ferredoxin oxidoreductase